MPDTDPNQVCLTGENSFIRLQLEENGTQMTRVSHWRILYSPGGPGHVLFMQSDVTDNAVHIYSDNIALTWYDFGEPFMLTVAAGSVPGRPHGVYSCFIPARRAQVTLNERVAVGQP